MAKGHSYTNTGSVDLVSRVLALFLAGNQHHVNFRGCRFCLPKISRILGGLRVRRNKHYLTCLIRAVWIDKKYWFGRKIGILGKKRQILDTIWGVTIPTLLSGFGCKMCHGLLIYVSYRSSVRPVRPSSVYLQVFIIPGDMFLTNKIHRHDQRMIYGAGKYLHLSYFLLKIYRNSFHRQSFFAYFLARLHFCSLVAEKTVPFTYRTQKIASPSFTSGPKPV